MKRKPDGVLRALINATVFRGLDVETDQAGGLKVSVPPEVVAALGELVQVRNGRLRLLKPAEIEEQKADAARARKAKAGALPGEWRGADRHESVSAQLLRYRLKTGWPVEAALALPVGSANPIETGRAFKSTLALLLPDGRKARVVAAENGIGATTWNNRVKRGWRLEDAVTVPAGGKRPDDGPAQAGGGSADTGGNRPGRAERSEAEALDDG